MVADQSDMDRGFEVSGGANGATPTDDFPSENLGMLLFKFDRSCRQSDEVLTLRVAFTPPV